MIASAKHTKLMKSCSVYKKKRESVMQQAREQQALLLKEATATRDAIVEKAQDKAHEESSRIISEAKSEIEAEKQNAFRDIRSQVVDLSVKVAENILRDQLSTDEKQMEYIGGCWIMCLLL